MALPSNSSFPAGGTWFDTLRRSFVDVPVDASKDNAIPTTAFLEAAESLTTLFGTFPHNPSPPILQVATMDRTKAE